ncbi:MAG: ABC transporter ATP-binding protein [Clostridia bacterium]|nr:ABC transporter ATP-binding protein [Clostridia bacterium]
MTDNILRNASALAEETAISMSDVSKRYVLGQINYGTLQADVQSWWARRRGRDDPNRKLTARSENGSFFALQDINLTVMRGETLGIIGRNGAGKSTLLKLLSRVTSPTTGTIDIYGRVSSLLEVGTGFNLQMTGRENIFLNGAILGMSHAEILSNLDSIIGFSEVEEFIDTPVKRYSSGMKVKLAFAVAAHLKCEIMIMDEVLAVGDSPFKKKCFAKLREIANESGRTVLYVSHDMSTVRELCRRCIVMDKGRIVYDGDTEGAIRTYEELGCSEKK